METLHLLPPEQQAVILAGPALKPPPGTTPNLENPPNQNEVGRAALIICLSAGSIATLLRVYSRAFIVKFVRLEDICALIGFGCYIGYIVLNFQLLEHPGFFVHQWDVTVQSAFDVIYLVVHGRILYSLTVAFVKVAILREFSRLFVPKPTRNGFWWACHVLMALNIVFYFIHGIVLTNIECIPRPRIWDKTVPGECYFDNKPVDLSAAVVNLASDLTILGLPQGIIWKLKMPLQQRIGLSVVFAMGFLACTAAAIRMAVSIQWYHSEDSVYSLGSVTLWAIAEMTCMLIAFCVPTAKNVFQKKSPLSKAASSITMGKSSKSRRNDTTDPNASYHKIGDNSIGLRDIKSGNSDGSTRQLQDPSKMEGGITYTTHFSAQEEISREMPKDDVRQYHVWDIRH